jgi:hypothetical protein
MGNHESLDKYYMIHSCRELLENAIYHHKKDDFNAADKLRGEAGGYAYYGRTKYEQQCDILHRGEDPMHNWVSYPGVIPIGEDDMLFVYGTDSYYDNPDLYFKYYKPEVFWPWLISACFIGLLAYALIKGFIEKY